MRTSTCCWATTRATATVGRRLGRWPVGERQPEAGCRGRAARRTRTFWAVGPFCLATSHVGPTRVRLEMTHRLSSDLRCRSWTALCCHFVVPEIDARLSHIYICTAAARRSACGATRAHGQHTRAAARRRGGRASTRPRALCPPDTRGGSCRAGGRAWSRVAAWRLWCAPASTSLSSECGTKLCRLCAQCQCPVPSGQCAI